MKYLPSVGKLGLLVFCFALVITWNGGIAKPFAVLLGGLLMAIFLLNLLSLAVFAARPRQGRKHWSDFLQLLLFGAFHLQAVVPQAQVAGSPVVGQGSEDQACASQAD